jgi:hypothetical protein
MADDLAGAHAAGVSEMILSSNPGNRRWYCGAKRAWRSHRHLQLDLAGVGNESSCHNHSLIAGLFAGQVMIHLGVENPFGQDLLEIVESAR